MTQLNDFLAPWSLHFDRDGTEDIAVISDRNGDHLATSRHFWIPEAKDPSSPTLNAMRVMAAAPKLLAALQGLLDATGSLPSTIMQGLFGDALYAANAAIAETEAPAFEHGP